MNFLFFWKRILAKEKTVWYNIRISLAWQAFLLYDINIVRLEKRRLYDIFQEIYGFLFGLCRVYGADISFQAFYDIQI